MRIALSIFIFLSIALFIFNLTKINWESPLSGDSTVALIGSIASASSFLLLVILILSKKISEKIKK
ncbi:MAG: hypothetical protein CBD68_04265 [Flavobacteriaceae bacterium TMED208]|nr:MAG: hypothetical protein CBD68_04265 [Flavobacteriaceae bacterium TMED208]|tara:strand:- start:512 stop:709 length:198 start_codon:yes stop_codon:yes gene_type:complete